MKDKILYVVVGICVALVAVYVWWFYQLSAVVSQDHNATAQIVDYLNKQIQASQPVPSAPVPKK